MPQLENSEKKVYGKPEIAALGRLDRFVDTMFNGNYNDGQKFYPGPPYPPTYYLILEMKTKS